MKMTTISTLTADLTRSLRRPGRKTLALIDKALSYLIPFEKPQTARSADTLYCEADTIKKDLLDLLNTHRLILSPYLDTDRVESNLRHTRSL
ncbi:MAG: hypothetical protein K2N48_12610 [Muribaculaceae bacterium]|nr:hypothetical protein [Muribaculaceae bacterium]